MSIKRVSRREALGILGVAGAAATLGCGGSSDVAGASSTPTTTGGTGSSATCAVTPTETIGPYPSLTNFVRSDIREGKAGLPLKVTITVVNANNACSPVANAAVDIWHSDADGHYSEYAQAGYNGTGQTYLRGIQTTDASGQVTFTSIFPGWYSGRATHVHVEVKVNNAVVKVTQFAFPESVNDAVYATGVYASRGPNRTANASDMVFADSLSSEMATVTGDPASGLNAAFTVVVAV